MDTRFSWRQRPADVFSVSQHHRNAGETPALPGTVHCLSTHNVRSDHSHRVEISGLPFQFVLSRGRRCVYIPRQSQIIVEIPIQRRTL